MSIYEPLTKDQIFKCHSVMDTEDYQNCLPKQQKHLCLLSVSLFILKATGTTSSFFQYLKVTGNHIVNSIIYTLVYCLWNLKYSSILREHRTCFVHFPLMALLGIIRATDFVSYFNVSQDIWVKCATLWWQKVKTKLVFNVKPKGRIYKPKPKSFALFRC